MPEKLLNDQAELGIPCLHCGFEAKMTIGWIRSNDEFACPACGHPVPIENRKIVEAIDRAKETVARILRHKG